MRSDPLDRRGPTTLFGSPLTPSERFLFDLARVLNGRGVECRSAGVAPPDEGGGATPAEADSPRQLRLDLGSPPCAAPAGRPCSER